MILKDLNDHLKLKDIIELVNDNSQTKERLIEQLRNSNNDSKSQYYKIFQIFELSESTELINNFS